MFMHTASTIPSWLLFCFYLVRAPQGGHQFFIRPVGIHHTENIWYNLNKIGLISYFGLIKKGTRGTGDGREHFSNLPHCKWVITQDVAPRYLA